MLIFNNFFESLVNLFFYVLIYNLSLIVLFWTLNQSVNSNLKTLHSFGDLRYNLFSLFTLTILLLSMAGVPPFLGFLSKLLILISLINVNFFFFYIFFFTLLFFGLYFYIQNIRFLYSSSAKTLNYSFTVFARVQLSYIYFTYFFLILLILGFSFFEDLFFCTLWLFI